MSQKKTPIGWYAKEIQRLTFCGEAEALVVEEIMRSHIFHSTLDWVSPESFAEAAREGLEILNEFRSVDSVPDTWRRILDEWED